MNAVVVILVSHRSLEVAVVVGVMQVGAHTSGRVEAMFMAGPQVCDATDGGQVIAEVVGVVFGTGQLI